MQQAVKSVKATALITPRPPMEEEAKVNGIFGNIEKHLGFVPDGLRLFGISPPLLETFVTNIGYFSMGGTQVPPPLMAMIRYQISWNGGCTFCIDMNEGFMMSMGIDIDRIRASRGKPDVAPFTPKEIALLKLVIKAVETPDAITKSDLDAVRNQGWDDRAIFDAVVQGANNRAFSTVLRTFKIEHQGSLA